MAVKRPTRLIQERRKRDFSPMYIETPTGELIAQYGFGDWIKRNAGNLAKTAAGAAITTFVPGGQTAGIGMMAGGIGGIAGDATSERSFKDQEREKKRLQQYQGLHSNLVDESVPYAPTFAKGGSINIKPSKRGTFKAQAKRMGKSVQEAASTILNAPEGKYSASMRKKANFAKNFGKSKKADGGPIKPTDISLYEISQSVPAEQLENIGVGDLIQFDGKVYNINKKGRRGMTMTHGLPDLYDIELAKDKQEFVNQYGEDAINRLSEKVNMTQGTRSTSLPNIRRRVENTRDARNRLYNKNLPEGALLDNIHPDELNMQLPTRAGGGSIVDYDTGQDHSGPDGGIPVDQQGNPSAISNAKPVALTEAGEVTWQTPEGEAYVFSNRIQADKKKTFADQAKKITKKYKSYLGEDFDKYHKPSRDSMNRELERLMQSQEQVKAEFAPPQEQIPQEQVVGDPNMMGAPDMGIEGMNTMLPEGMPVMDDGGGIVGPTRKTFSSDNTTQSEWEPYQGGVSPVALAMPLVSNLGEMAGYRNRMNRRAPIRLPRTTAQQVNFEPSRVAAKETAGEQKAVGRRAYRGMGASPGATLAATSAMETGINRQLGQTLSESYGQEGMTNAQLRAEAARINAEMAMRETMMDREEDIRDEDIMRGYRTSLASSVNRYLADDQRSREAADYLQMIQPEFHMEQEVTSPVQRAFSRPRRRITKR